MSFHKGLPQAFILSLIRFVRNKLLEDLITNIHGTLMFNFLYPSFKKWPYEAFKALKDITFKR